MSIYSRYLLAQIARPMVTAILVALFSVRVQKFMLDHGAVIKMPASVPEAVQESFLSLTPMLSGQMLGHLALYLLFANGSRFMIVIALAKADLAALAPLGYSEVVFAAAIQWLVLGQSISPFEAAAFTAILAAGLGVAQIRCRPPRVPSKD